MGAASPPGSRPGYLAGLLALGGCRTVPAWVQLRSMPVASQATSTRSLPKIAATRSPLRGAGSSTLFCSLMLPSASVPTRNVAIPSLANADTAVLGTKGATTAPRRRESVARSATARTSSSVDRTQRHAAGHLALRRRGLPC